MYSRFADFIIIFIFVSSTTLVGSAHGLSEGDSLVDVSENNFAVDTQLNSTIRDVDTDGDPDIVKLSKDFTGDGHTDSILIIDRGDDMTRAESPRQMIDYRNDLLIYDAGDDGVAELVVSFDRTSGEYPWKAELYDSRIGKLRYDLDTGTPTVPLIQNHSATITMASQVPWIQNETVSYSLRMKCDPAVRCSFDAPKYDPEGVTIRVVDRNQDGTPDYEIRQIDTGRPPAATLHRTELMVNRGTEDTIPSSDGILWPYIGSSEDFSYTGGGHPPLLVDWQNGTMSAVAEFVASRGDEDNYFIYSFRALNRDVINPPSFEYPFSFYDLAGDDDGTPELQVRIVAHSQGSLHGLNLHPSRLPFDFAQVRYSWDQTNDGRWDYKIGVVGTNGYEDVTAVGPYRLRKPAYREVPGWVQDQRWRAVSFVAVAEGFRSSEGIYTGGFGTTERREVLRIDSASTPLLESPSQGYRLEVNGNYDAQPRLYFSPVDENLHLLNLNYGFWNRSDAPNVNYHNVDNDPYVDVWTTQDESKRRLIAENDHLVYTDHGTISFKRASIEHSELTARPPTTTDEWKQLGERIPNQPNATFDIEETFRRYDGETFAVTDATFTDYVPTDDGFRIYATLSSESRMRNTSLTLPDTNQVVFVFHDDQGTVDVHRATPPSLSLKNASADAESITPLEQNMINIAVRNDGWQTARNVTVALTDDDGTIANRTVSVVGKQTRTVKLQWWPTSDYTESTIEVRFDGETVATQPLVGTLEHREAPSLLVRYGIGNWSTPLTLGTGLAVSLGLLVIARRILG